MNKKIILFLVLIMLGAISMWYINYPVFEKRAEDRIHKYMDAQDMDQRKIINQQSSKDKKTGTWAIIIKFEDETNVTYEYKYDKDKDGVLLTVYETPNMTGGQSIDKGMNYPPLTTDWVQFDPKGNIKITDY